MRWKTAIPLALLGSIPIFVLVHIRETRTPSSPQTNSKDTLQGNVFGSTLHGKPPSTEVRESGEKTSQKSIVAPESNWQDAALVRRILASSDPRAGYLYKDALGKIRKGKFSETRRALQQLMDLFPNDRSVPLANWSMGLAYYKEGGRENVRKAADKFKEFDLGYEYEPDLEELHQAAEINVALIELDLMNSATGEMLRSEMTAQKVGAAVLGLKSFLARWPDTQFAPAAQAALREIMDLTSPH